MAAPSTKTGLLAARFIGRATVSDASYGGLSEHLKDEDEEESEEEEESSCVFPCEPFAFFPGADKVLPSTFTKLHSWSQLVLLMGITFNLVIIVISLMWFVSWQSKGPTEVAPPPGSTEKPEGVSKEAWFWIDWTDFILVCLMVGISLRYFMRTIAQYGSSLMEQKKEFKRLKKVHASECQSALTELDTFINRAVDTQACLAERSFESKRRDFVRFLQRAESHFEGIAENSAEALLLLFRAFVLQWLDIFSECCIDPIKTPLRPVDPEELNRCATSSQVAATTAGYLKEHEVKFITAEQEAHKKQTSFFRKGLKKLLRRHKSVVQETLHFTTQMECDSDNSSAAENGDAKAKRKRRRWLRFCHPGCGFRFATNTDQAKSKLRQSSVSCVQTPYPFEMRFGVIKMVILSAEQFYLIIALHICWMLVPLELLNMETFSPTGWTFRTKVTLCEVLLNIVCISFVLHQFLDIDVVQQLEEQLFELQEEKRALDEKKERIIAFHASAQLLSGLWLHRTAPRLALMKHFHEELEDLSGDKLMTFLANVNANVEGLERAMPALHLWANEETLSNAEKKKLGDMVMELTRFSGVDEALNALPEVCNALALEADPDTAGIADRHGQGRGQEHNLAASMRSPGK